MISAPGNSWLPQQWSPLAWLFTTRAAGPSQTSLYRRIISRVWGRSQNVSTTSPPARFTSPEFE